MPTILVAEMLTAGRAENCLRFSKRILKKNRPRSRTLLKPVRAERAKLQMNRRSLHLMETGLRKLVDVLLDSKEDRRDIAQCLLMHFGSKAAAVMVQTFLVMASA